VIISAHGGSGSEFLTRALSAHSRPDKSFFHDDRKNVWPNYHLDLNDSVTEEDCELFLYRTRGQHSYNLNREKTVNENMIEYFNYINENDKNCVLNGILSWCCQFLTRNKIKGVNLLIRHPLHSYVSLFSHRHPKMQKRIGKLGSEESMTYHANIWNGIVDDFLNSENKILRYEYAYDDAKRYGLKDGLGVIKKIRSSRRNSNELTKDQENFYRELTGENFKEIYKKWDI
jgi:hypothetical protein